MPNPNVTFNGVSVIKPGAYSKIDASELVPSSQGLATVVALLGDATGGVPGEPYFFRSGSAAKSVLRSGPLLDAIRFAYSPSTDGSAGGADLIVALRTNPATQSDLDLVDTNLSPATALTVTSIDYGAWTTGIEIKVEAGSSSGKKITIKYVDPVLGTILEVYDNVVGKAAAADAINNGLTNGQGPSQFVTAASVGANTDPLANIAFTALAGGAEGTTTSTQYTNALTKLELEDVDIVVPITSDDTITALVKAHVESMSTTKGRKERIAIVGGTPFEDSSSAADYVDDLVALADDLDSERVLLVAPDIKMPDDTGVVTTYGPEFLAAMVAGLAAAQQVGETPTNKLLKLIGLTCAFTQDQIETLLLGGVCPVEFIKSDGFRVVQAITTWQTDAIPLHREFSVRRVGDAIMKDLRRTLQRDFVGARGDATTVQSMLSTIVQRLQRYLSDRIITGFRNVSVTVASTIATVTFEFAPTEPINYILITGTAKPGSLSASFSGQDSFSGTVGS